MEKDARIPITRIGTTGSDLVRTYGRESGLSQISEVEGRYWMRGHFTENDPEGKALLVAWAMTGWHEA